MLRELHIANLALIENCSLTFDDGFSVFTGETGAGKSILIGAIGLLLGERAYNEQVRTGTEKAEVRGTFDMKRIPPLLKEVLDEFELGDEMDALIIRRIILRNGKNKVFINQVPVPLTILKKIGNHLIDLHGQHDHQSLLHPDTPRIIIDGLDGPDTAFAAYAKAWEAFCIAREALAEHDHAARLRLERKEVIEFHYREIAGLKLTENEETILNEELLLLTSATERTQHAGAVADVLSDDTTGITRQIGAVLKHLESLARYDESVRPWITDVENVQSLCNDLESYCTGYCDHAGESSDPGRLEAINQRLARIQRLKKKNNCTFDELRQKEVALAQELQAIENTDADRAQLVKRCTEAEKTVRLRGTALSASRKSAARQFDAQVGGQMESLGFADGTWQTAFSPLAEPAPAGLETMSFMVRTNPGEPLLPLARTASGGEISRLMLAIKSVLAEKDDIPVLIFDEIDTGIGGVLASSVANALYRLSRSHQVLCISHLHQIASQADTHYRVFKETVDGRTQTRARMLSDEEKVEEIARMLGETSDISRTHARSLLKKR